MESITKNNSEMDIRYIRYIIYRKWMCRISTYKGSFHSGKRSWTTRTWIKDNSSNMNRLIIENRIVLIYFFNKFWINIGATIWKYVEYHWLTWFLFQIFIKKHRHFQPNTFYILLYPFILYVCIIKFFLWKKPWSYKNHSFGKLF